MNFIFNLKKILSHKMMKKVPNPSLSFWVIKLLTTAFGESSSDYLVHHIDPVFAVLIGAAGLLIGLIIQFIANRYNRWSYWFAAIMVAVFGTMAADVVHIVLGVPYLLSSVFFFCLLIAIFFIWFKRENSLSIHSITTTQRELFYWAVVITTFALGTAVGDMSASTFRLGYLYSGIFFAFLFLLPGVLFFILKKGSVAFFWTAYVLTRPLGASFADWTGRGLDAGGIGLGTGKVSIFLIILIIILIFLSDHKKKAALS